MVLVHFAELMLGWFVLSIFVGFGVGAVIRFGSR